MLLKKDAVVCPNCDNPFPKENLENLKIALEHLALAHKMEHMDVPHGFMAPFYFSFEDS